MAIYERPLTVALTTEAHGSQKGNEISICSGNDFNFITPGPIGYRVLGADSRSSRIPHLGRAEKPRFHDPFLNQDKAYRIANSLRELRVSQIAMETIILRNLLYMSLPFVSFASLCSVSLNVLFFDTMES
jgi:hypothetical protein